MYEKVQLLVNKSNTKKHTDKKISTLSAHSASAHCQLVLMLQHHNCVYGYQHTDRVTITPQLNIFCSGQSW